jgi:hypothetical protein
VRVGFDLDGVLYNYSDSVYATMQLPEINLGHLWKSGPTKKPYWNYFEDWSKPDGTRYTFEEYRKIVDYGADKGIVFGPGFFRPGARDAVSSIRDLGHEVIFLTDRFFGTDPTNSHRNTYKAFEDEGIEYDEIHFTKDKCSVQIDTMVEDKLENYDALIDASVPTWLINRPWNEIPGGDARNRIDDVSDYVEAVKRITAEGLVDLSLV